jgi:hypothetical protein
MWNQSSSRWRGIVSFAIALSFFGILVGCADELPTTPFPRGFEPAGNGELYADAVLGVSGGPSTASDQLAKVVPGFGGAFVANGVLNVYLTPNANTTQGQAVARTAIHDLFAEGQRPQMEMSFLPAKYSFIQLRTWENALRSLYRRFGVHTAQIDERVNHFRLTLFDASVDPMLRGELAAFGIPTEAVETEAAPRVVPFVDLNDKVRPAGGGLRIMSMFAVNGVQQPRLLCTYGFNAQIDDGSGTRYVVTNAHCVEPEDVFGGVDGATVTQPADSSVTSLVGSVTVNPSSQSGISGCAPGDSCRESDAVLVQTNSFRFPASSWDIGESNRLTREV